MSFSAFMRKPSALVKLCAPFMSRASALLNYASAFMHLASAFMHLASAFVNLPYARLSLACAFEFQPFDLLIDVAIPAKLTGDVSFGQQRYVHYAVLIVVQQRVA